jgi:hypothetical protein
VVRLFIPIILKAFGTCFSSGFIEVFIVSYELIEDKGNRNFGIFRTFQSLPLLINYLKKDQGNDPLTITVLVTAIKAIYNLYHSSAVSSVDQGNVRVQTCDQGAVNTS